MADNPNPNVVKDRKFGELNDVSKPVIRKRFNLNNNQTFGAIAKATRDTFIPDGLSNVGQFKGVVLNVVTGPGTEGKKQEPGGWFSSFFEDESSISEYGMLVEIKVRVPEVHSMLPIPDAIGPDAPPDQQAIMDMYPTFVAQSTAVQVPAPGDLVWVDWGNRQNWTDPYYIRPVKEMAAGAAAGGPGGQGAHANCSGGAYSATPPAGDPVAGKNASLPAHTGLPRLKRVPKKPTGKHVILSGLSKRPGVTMPVTRIARSPINPDVAARWEKIVKKAFPPGRSVIAYSPYNGKDDKNAISASGANIHTTSRANIVYYSNNTDFDQPWELMYFFHGLDEFTSKHFEKQIAPQISTAVAQGRNFVLVMPELPWSKHFGGKRQKEAFTGKSSGTYNGDYFQDYQMDMLSLIKSMHGKKPKDPSMISIHAHSAGGGALKNIVTNYSPLNPIDITRLVLSDCDYMTVTKEVWDRYVKNKKDVWMTCITTKGKTRTATELVFKNDIKDLQKERDLYHIKTKKSHSWCGANCMITFSEEMIERKKSKAVDKKKEADAAPPSDEEGEENKAEDTAAAAEKTGVEKLPKKDPSGANPPPQTTPTPASEQKKESNTTKKASFKLGNAELKYQENRVKLKEYGGSLVGAAASKLLVTVETSPKVVKLHKLVAVRYKALKAEAIKKFPQFTISSGWRRHRWKDRAHYEATLIKKYGSVKAGRKWLAFNSPHESGMAMDIRAHGLYASKGGSKTVAAQEKTDLFKWMKENAYKYGFTPYKAEPWHWEIRLPWDAYATGQEFVDMSKPADEKFKVRVSYIGGKNAQLPTGPATGGGTGTASGTSGGDKRCVSTGGGGPSAPPGPYKPGVAYAVTGGGKLGSKLQACPPPKEGGQWGEHPGAWVQECNLFVIHETAGWDYGGATSKRRLGNRSVKKLVHYWGSSDGTIQQCCHPAQLAYHANCTNRHSVGIEVHGFGTTGGNKYATWQKKCAMGMHIISMRGWGDIAVQPGMKLSTNTKEQHLPTPAACESTWQLIVSLVKNPPPIPPEAVHTVGARKIGIKKWEGKSKIAIPMKFPTGIEGNKFWWSKWNGGPTRDQHSAHEWFKKHRPKGITSHARIHNHHDGVPIEYYCYARAAKGMSPKNAYWAMVGALCSGTREGAKGCWTPLPNAAMVARGKKKYPSAWFKAKTSRMVGKKKWKELAAANPQWFATPELHGFAGKKGYS